MSYAFTTESVEYIRHGDKPQMAKLYLPAGDGPFPMVIDLHGGVKSRWRTVEAWIAKTIC
jgi:hypothetical protein